MTYDDASQEIDFGAGEDPGVGRMVDPRGDDEERQVEAAGRCGPAEPFGPLDDADRPAEGLVEPELGDLAGVAEAVEVDVPELERQRGGADLVDLHEGVARARHVLDPPDGGEAGGDEGAGEGALAGAEIAAQAEEIAGREVGGHRDGERVRRRVLERTTRRPIFAADGSRLESVAPGLAGLETVLTLHDASRIGDPRATWAVIEGNPVHDDIRAVVAAVGGVDFGLDVVLNLEQRIVSAYGGSLAEMHAAAREASQRLAMQPVPSLFEVVVTTNAGYPLDQNLYQAVKGMSAAATVVRQDGLILCAAECRDGFPDHGSYREVLASEPSPEALLATIAARERTVPDQWQVQVQAKVQAHAQVVVHTSYLSPADLAAAETGPQDDEGIAAMSRTVEPNSDAPSRSGITGEGSGADAQGT